jgi:hypothetical protein
MVLLSRENAGKEGVSDKVTFMEGDLFNADLSKATVITLFLLPEINLKLRPRLLDLKPGTRIVSNTFTMSGWVADSSVTTQENWNSWNTAFLWIVPAKAAGLWKSGNSVNRYSAMVDGDTMKGTILNMKAGTKTDFLATREVSNQ